MSKQYMVNEVFYSIQGEGVRVGTANVFVRFAGCNLNCNRDEHGFDCDTDFTGGTKMDASTLLAKCNEVRGVNGARQVIFTGGEPSLQYDELLAKEFETWYRCMETNGTNKIKGDVEFISCSPKTADHTLRLDRVNELRYVIANNQALPRPRYRCSQKFISPAFEPTGDVKPSTLAWCVQLVKENPTWKLSLQTHKLFHPTR